MKITLRQLQKIIQEEISDILEQDEEQDEEEEEPEDGQIGVAPNVKTSNTTPMSKI